MENDPTLDMYTYIDRSATFLMISVDQLHAFVCILTHSCVSKVKHESDRNEFSYPILPIQNLEIKVKGQCHIVIQNYISGSSHDDILVELAICQ